MTHQTRRSGTSVLGPDHGGRVRLDFARGVLMGWSGCDEHQAFDELVAVAGLHSMSVFDLVAAVLTVARDQRADTPRVDQPAGVTAVVTRCRRPTPPAPSSLAVSHVAG